VGGCWNIPTGVPNTRSFNWRFVVMFAAAGPIGTTERR
jgi:hypothetical protein